MASDDDDVDLDALRSAVLATLKTRDKQNASPQLGGSFQRDSDIENLRIAALHSARQVEAPILNFPKNNFMSHPRGNYHRDYGSPRFGFSNSPRGNLIVIQPVPIHNEADSAPPPVQLAAQRVESQTIPSIFQAHTQDRYGRTTEDEASQSPGGQKTKRADKFSRFQSDSESDSDDDDYLLKSDNDNAESDSRTEDESPANGGSGDDGSRGIEEEDDGEEVEGDPIEDVLLLHPNEKIVEEEEEEEEDGPAPNSADGSQAGGGGDDAESEAEVVQPSASPSRHSSQENSQQRDEAFPADHRRSGHGSPSQPSERRRDERRQGPSDPRRIERSRRDPAERGKDVADMRQDSRRSERSSGRLDESRRRKDRIRDVPRQRPGRTEQLPSSDSRRENQRKRQPSPLKSSPNRTLGDRHELKTKFPLQSASRNTSAEEQQQPPPTADSKFVKRSRVSPVKSRARGRQQQQATSPRPPDPAVRPRRNEGLHDLREKLKLRSRDADEEVVSEKRRQKVAQDDEIKPLRRDRSPLTRRAGLQSIVKLQPPPRSSHSGSRSVGASPVRSLGRHSPGTEMIAATSSKRSRSPTESLNLRKVLFVKEKSYGGDDMHASRHGFNVTLSEVPDLPDSDSSTSNRLPVHLRLGHFAKSSSSLNQDAAGEEQPRPSKHSSSDGKSTSRHTKSKRKSRQRQQPADDHSSPRHVKLKRESSSTIQPSSSSLSRVLPSNGHSSKRTQKQSGRTYESDLDERIRRIKEVNEAILKRKTEIERDQQANY